MRDPLKEVALGVPGYQFGSSRVNELRDPANMDLGRAGEAGISYGSAPARAQSPDLVPQFFPDPIAGVDPSDLW